MGLRNTKIHISGAASAIERGIDSDIIDIIGIAASWTFNKLITKSVNTGYGRIYNKWESSGAIDRQRSNRSKHSILIQ